MRMLVAMTAAIMFAGTAVVAQPKAPAEAAAFANKVAHANTFEIQQMIKDHTKAGNDFKSAVAEAHISPPPPEAPDAEQKATLLQLKNARKLRAGAPR